MGEWLLIDEQYLNYIIAWTNYIWWDNNDVGCDWLDFFSASSLKQCPRLDMSLHSDTLSWFRVNPSLPFLLNAACLAEKKINKLVFGRVKIFNLFLCNISEWFRERPFNLKGGLWFFSKKKNLIPNVAEKNILILVEEKNNNLIQSFCHIT